MKRLAEKRWVRVLAAVLFVFFLLLSMAAAALVRYGRGDNWYRMGGSDSFASTYSCRDYVNNANYYVEQNVRWMEDMTLDHLGSYAGSAYSYVIVDGNGKTTVDTRTERSVFVSDNGFVPVPEPGFTVQGYINLPVAPYDGCYSEYFVFAMFFRFRYYLLALKILSMLLGGLCLWVLCLGAAQRGREGRLKPWLSLPYDAVLLGGLILYACAGRISDRLAHLVINLLLVYTGSLQGSVFAALSGSFTNLADMIIIAALVWYLSGQIGGGVLFKNVISVRLLRRIPQPVFVLVLLAAHLALLYFFTSEWFYFSDSYRPVMIILMAFDIVAAAALILYQREGVKIRNAARELSSGNLSYKTDEKKLHFIWRSLGEDLNRIGDGMAQAVESRMRSERMKTELITNVSHDLKTPLTSVINYVDFLKSDELDPETRREYLAILDRQSHRLKKLTEDVVAASKAASGTLEVHPEPIDMGELLEQFLGEYGDRLSAAQIEPVLTVPKERTIIRADSVLLGRVIDNLIVNVVKYAMPGTRAYFDLLAEDGYVLLAVKNISRLPLNITAEELMERFVRGDSSRHTEGSGLGLSIARSLTELMGGDLELVLDGDLFKAVLRFEAAGEGGE